MAKKGEPLLRHAQISNEQLAIGERRRTVALQIPVADLIPGRDKTSVPVLRFVKVVNRSGSAGVRGELGKLKETTIPAEVAVEQDVIPLDGLAEVGAAPDSPQPAEPQRESVAPFIDVIVVTDARSLEAARRQLKRAKRGMRVRAVEGEKDDDGVALEITDERNRWLSMFRKQPSVGVYVTGGKNPMQVMLETVDAPASVNGVNLDKGSTMDAEGERGEVLVTDATGEVDATVTTGIVRMEEFDGTSSSRVGGTVIGKGRVVGERLRGKHSVVGRNVDAEYHEVAGFITYATERGKLVVDGQEEPKHREHLSLTVDGGSSTSVEHVLGELDIDTNGSVNVTNSTVRVEIDGGKGFVRLDDVQLREVNTIGTKRGDIYIGDKGTDAMGVSLSRTARGGRLRRQKTVEARRFKRYTRNTRGGVGAGIIAYRDGVLDGDGVVLNVASHKGEVIVENKTAPKAAA